MFCSNVKSKHCFVFILELSVFVWNMSYWSVCAMSAQCQSVSQWVMLLAKLHFFFFLLFVFLVNFWEHSARYDKGTTSRIIRWFLFLLQQILPPSSVSGIQLKNEEKEKLFFFSTTVWCLFRHMVCTICWGSLSHTTRSKLKQNKPMHAITHSPLHPSFHFLSFSAPLFFTHFLWLCN